MIEDLYLFLLGFSLSSSFVIPLFSRTVALRVGQILALVGVLIVAMIFSKFELGKIYEIHTPILSDLRVNFILGLNGINLVLIVMIVLSTLLTATCLKTHTKRTMSTLFLIQFGFLLVTLAKDLILFYVGWEFMLLPIFFYTGLRSTDAEAQKATFKMLIYSVVGSLLMLLAIISIGVHYGQVYGALTFKIDTLADAQLNLKPWHFLAFMAAFAIKAPLFPFHMWLPNAYEKSPTGATFALSAIASKVSVLAIVSIVLPLFAHLSEAYSLFFVGLGVFSLIYFALCAYMQKGLKKIVAYSSASHLGLIVAGAISLNYIALGASMFQILAHMLSTGVLFILIGKVLEEGFEGTLNELGGMAKTAPIFVTVFAVAIFCSVGLPGTAGFIGEFLIIIGLLKTNLFLGVLAATSAFLGTAYLLIMFRKAFLQEDIRIIKMVDLNLKETFVLGLVVVLIVLLGLYPQLVLDKIDWTITNSYILESK